MIELIKYIQRQKEWSIKTFGEGKRTMGLCEHIKSELEEIKRTPDDVMEWVDILILGLDGAWRTEATPEQIVKTLIRKQEINFARKWPDPSSEDKPNFHVHKCPECDKYYTPGCICDVP
jgi:hypothetical protein